ncbi:MAG: metalloregulator ArsR/SmtB family transcription factor [Chloroflexota bacterium]
MDDLEQRVFAALSDPTRRQLVESLASTENITATELANVLPMTRQGVTKHLKILVQAELVQSHKIGREMLYSLNPEPLTKTTVWIANITAQWDRRLQKLTDYLLDEDEEVDGG